MTTKKYTPFDAIKQIIIAGPPIHPVEPQRGSWSANYTFRQYVVERAKNDGWGFLARYPWPTRRPARSRHSSIAAWAATASSNGAGKTNLESLAPIRILAKSRSTDCDSSGGALGTDLLAEHGPAFAKHGGFQLTCKKNKSRVPMQRSKIRA